MKKIIIVLFFSPVCISAQSDNKIIPSWALEHIFSRSSDMYSNTYNTQLFWTNSSSKEFLLNKLDSNISLADKVKTFTYLGMSKDTSIISVISPYLINNELYVQKSAVSALTIIGSEECFNILEEYLINPVLEDRDLTLEVLDGLSKGTSPHSIKRIEEFIAQRAENEPNYNLVSKKAIEVLQTIQQFNKNEQTRRQLINELLESGQWDEIDFALTKIKQLNDSSFLPELKALSIKLEKEYYRDYIKVIKLRQFLGYNNFTSPEQKALEKLASENDLYELKSKEYLERLIKNGPPNIVKDF